MDDVVRIRAFDRWLEEAVAERREPWRFGTVLSDDTFPNKYDANFLRVERSVGDATAADLHAIADRVQTHLTHREFVFLDDAEGARLAAAFTELGYRSERLITLVLRREPDRPAPATFTAGEVTFDDSRELSVRANVESAEPMLREDAEMLADYRTVLRDRIGARSFAAWDGDVLAGACELYLHDGIAQIESVETLEAHRNRGVARAFLAAAIEAAREGGADLIFLRADDADWPKHLYAKLGFDDIGLAYRQFTRWPAPS